MKLKRLFLALSAVLALLALSLYYQQSYQSHLEYPSAKSIVSDYSRYVGQRVALLGDVVESSGNGMKIVVYQGGGAELTIVTETMATRGDNVEVLGILEPGYRLTPEKLAVHKKWKTDLVLVRSAVAIPVILFVFFRNWRFDPKTSRFVRRG